MLSKEDCLGRIKELAETCRIHGRLLLTSQQLFAAYTRRRKELMKSYFSLSQNDRAWLEKKTLEYNRHLLKEIKKGKEDGQGKESDL